MNISGLLNQQVVWEAQTGEDNRGDSTYGTPITVQARTVLKLHDIIGRDGEVTTVTTQVNMLVQPGIGDLLDGREVVTVAEQVTVGGQSVGFLALCR